VISNQMFSARSPNVYRVSRVGGVCSGVCGVRFRRAGVRGGAAAGSAATVRKSIFGGGEGVRSVHDPLCIYMRPLLQNFQQRGVQ
jgi:hypothetical protein